MSDEKEELSIENSLQLLDAKKVLFDSINYNADNVSDYTIGYYNGFEAAIAILAGRLPHPILVMREK